MRCNSLDEQTILLSLFGNRALYLIFLCIAKLNTAMVALLIVVTRTWLNHSSQYLDQSSSPSSYYSFIAHLLSFVCCK